MVGVRTQPARRRPAVDTLERRRLLPVALWNHNGGNIKAAQAVVDQWATPSEKSSAQAAADLATAETTYHEASRAFAPYREEIRAQIRRRPRIGRI